MHLAASEGDHAGLQRRTQRLDDGGLELWRLIEKEHTFVSQWSVKFLNRIPA
jgi:hypothetical protein